SNCFEENEMLKIISGFQGIVVIDEAYIDFSQKKSFINTLNEYPQVIVLQTFSKAMGMAGIRLGMAFTSRQIVNVLHKIKQPYNVSGLTQAAALASLALLADKQDKITHILGERSRLKEALHELSFVQYTFPSDANFLLVKVAAVKTLYDFLCEK